MQVEVGAVVEGTVTGITKFGAFVSLPDGRSGLVHISEIANTYVNDVNEFLKLGDKVKVRVLAVTPDGKINLSIKKAEPAPERPNNRPMHGGRPGGNRPNNNGGKCWPKAFFALTSPTRQSFYGIRRRTARRAPEQPFGPADGTGQRPERGRCV